jgi:serine/threonine protein kinase
MFIHAEREFAIMERLNGNKNIVKGEEYVPEQRRSRGYIVMEKIKGETILNMVAQTEEQYHAKIGGPFSEDRARIIMRQIVNAVQYMHERGVIHRDMNPTNVFIVEDNLVKILDFNVSKLVDKDQSQFL